MISHHSQFGGYARYSKITNTERVASINLHKMVDNVLPPESFEYFYSQIDAEVRSGLRQLDEKFIETWGRIE